MAMGAGLNLQDQDTAIRILYVVRPHKAEIVAELEGVITACPWKP